MNIYALDYRGINAGDWIQSLASSQFIPYITNTIERDSGRLNRTKEVASVDEDSALIFNGWFNLGDFSYLDKIKKILPISVNLQPGFFDKEIPNFIKESTIGCRDLNTYDNLVGSNPNSYFSACLTLLLKGEDVVDRSNGKIIINEMDRVWRGDGPVSKMGKNELNKNKSDFIYENIDSEIRSYLEQLIPANLLSNATFTDHDIYELRDGTYKEAMSVSSRILDEYRTAKLVITSRLHTALPCLAFNTPVIFIWWKNDYRLTGLLPLFENFCDINDFKSGKLDFSNIGCRNEEYYQDIKNKLLEKIINFQKEIGIPYTYNTYENILNLI